MRLIFAQNLRTD